MKRGNARDNIERYDLRSPEQTYSYQASDWEVADYRFKRFHNTSVFFRRSPFNKTGIDTSGGRKRRPRLAMLGGAQILGRFCPTALSHIITETTHWNGRNFGHAGATPELFQALGEPFFNAVNACAAAVVQVMSARASANAHFSTPDHLVPNHVLPVGERDSVFINRAWGGLVETLSEQQVIGVVAQSRADYVVCMQRLLARITVPKILLWYSDRPLDYDFDGASWKGVLGPFPQLVTSRMVRALIPSCDAYVEVIGSVGRPHRLLNRFTGQPVMFYTERQEPEVNFYYPAPAMHAEAAQALAPALRRFER